MTILAVLAVWLLPEPPRAAAGGPRLDGGERALLRALNRTRAAHGLHRVRRSRRLARAADAHCLDMLRANFVAHTSSNGTPMGTRVSRYRPSNRLGETLAYMPGRGRRGAARQVVSMWMSSPGHRAAVLSSGFRRVGIARRRGRMGNQRAAVYTVDFASRR
jgi:uncharacterized protein YkwD